jgi:hypothetical protein
VAAAAPRRLNQVGPGQEEGDEQKKGHEVACMLDHGSHSHKGWTSGVWAGGIDHSSELF